MLNNKLSAIQDSILSVPEPVNSRLDSDSDSESDFEIMPPIATPRSSGNHPRFGEKTPKNHTPPRVNVQCRKEREAKNKEIDDLKLKVNELMEELSKYMY